MRTIILILALVPAALAQQMVNCATGTFSYSSLMAFGSQEVTILTDVSDNVHYNQITLSETTRFDNIEGLTVSMGRPGDKTNYEMTGARFALGVSSGDNNFWNTRPDTLQGLSTYSVVLAFMSTLGNLNAATAGVLTWEVCGYGTLPAEPNSYIVGDVAPATSDTAPNFGDGRLDMLDLTQLMYAVNNVPGYRPTACSDRFDAMDVYPVDAGSTRGGDGVLDARDLVREWFRVSNLDLDRPVRATRLGTCPTITGSAESQRNSEFALSHREALGRIVLGVAESSSEAERRVPLYLEPTRDGSRVALTVALGDQRSRLRFVPAPHTPHPLVRDDELGIVALAWLEGVNVKAGRRLLLGYVVGPSIAANLEVFGMSAYGLDDDGEILLEASPSSDTESAVKRTDIYRTLELQHCR
jgi:hypothetical protein